MRPTPLHCHGLSPLARWGCSRWRGGDAPTGEAGMLPLCKICCSNSLFPFAVLLRGGDAPTAEVGMFPLPMWDVQFADIVKDTYVVGMFPLARWGCSHFANFAVPICSFILRGVLFQFVVYFARWGCPHYQGGDVPTGKVGACTTTTPQSSEPGGDGPIVP